MDQQLPDVSDERLARLVAGEPRISWGLPEHLGVWAPGRVLPSRRSSALQLECLAIHSGAKTLECGAGRGWMSTLLLGMGARLCAVEPDLGIWRELAKRMPSDVPLCCGRILDGWVEAAPFDRICLTEILRAPPDALLPQLSEGGRMVYWLFDGEGIGLWLDVLLLGNLVRERLAFVGLEGGPEELEALLGA